MINTIIGFHHDLKENQYLEIMTKTKNTIYIHSSDVLEKKVYVLIVKNPNGGSKIAIDTDSVVWCLVKEKGGIFQ